MGAKQSQTYLKTLLELGRVSNILTVFSNILLAAIISKSFQLDTLAILCFGGGLFYTSGMYFNDYFDYEWDLKNKNERPIIQGHIKKNHVLFLGFVQLILALICFISSLKTFSVIPFISLLTLIGFIFWYNLDHKNNKYSPILMGMCRANLIISSYLFLTEKPQAIILLFAFIYIIYTSAITYMAKFEHTNHKNFKLLLKAILLLPIFILIPWMESKFSYIMAFLSFAWLCYLMIQIKKNSIGFTIVSCIAGMCLIDGIFIANQGFLFFSISILLFLLTLLLQRIIRGT